MKHFSAAWILALALCASVALSGPARAWELANMAGASGETGLGSPAAAFKDGDAEARRAVRGASLTLASNESYEQDWLFESRGSWQNVGWIQDNQGQTYFILYDSAGENTHIYRAASGLSGNISRSDIEAFGTLMTIPGRASIALSPDDTRPYLYYSTGSTELYRVLLSGGTVSEPEVRDFSLEGSRFVFSGFSLVDSDHILLCSYEEGGVVTVGLFSYSNWTTGNNEPIRTWYCILPSERNFTPLANEIGHHVTYEASTGKVWLTVMNTYPSSGANYYRWYYSAPISQGGYLAFFDPETEVPDWDVDQNFKQLWIGRHYRNVTFTNVTYPEIAFSAIASYRVSADGGMARIGWVDTWRDSSGTTRPLSTLWTSSSSAVRWYGNSIDPLSNIFVTHSHSDRSGNESFVRIAHFMADRSHLVEQPEDYDTPIAQPGNRVILRASPFRGPSDHVVTGSHWEVFIADYVADGIFEGKIPIYQADVTTTASALSIAAADAHNVHTLTDELPEGDYVWRMFYRYQIGGAGSQGQRGVSPWSRPASLTATAPEKGNSGGGGGCSAGFGALGLMLCAAVALGARKGK